MTYGQQRERNKVENRYVAEITICVIVRRRIVRSVYTVFEIYGSAPPATYASRFEIRDFLLSATVECILNEYILKETVLFSYREKKYLQNYLTYTQVNLTYTCILKDVVYIIKFDETSNLWIENYRIENL